MVKTVTNAFLVLLLTTAAVTASAQVAGTASGPAEKEVLQTLDALDQAIDKRDKAALERLMADEFVYHGSNGVAQTKAQSIAQTTAGGTAWSGRKYDNIKVRIYGEIAVVTGSTELWVRRPISKPAHGCSPASSSGAMVGGRTSEGR